MQVSINPKAVNVLEDKVGGHLCNVEAGTYC